jgi:Lon protease-like protein
MKLALFPLNTVIFPGSILPLKIFEQRYLNLIKECMKQQTGFVIVLISEGKEVGARPEIYGTGCYVEIIDWQALPGGLLGISVQAQYRVRLSNSSVRDDGLLFAEATPSKSALDDKPPLPEVYEPLAETLKQLLKHPFAQRYQGRINFVDAADICYRLGELLPISNLQKQQLLETETTEQMLDLLSLHINTLQT